MTTEGGSVAPGLALLPRRGAPRLLGRALLDHLGLEMLPPDVGSLSQLLEAAGFHPRPGNTRLWERDGRVVLAGEEWLEDDAARLVWTVRPPWSEDQVDRQVRYLGMASHDLRGSLANIRSYAALLLNGRVPLEPKAKRGLETILRNADRALAFSQDFFDASRADLGSLACEREHQSLVPVLEAAVARARPATEGAQVSLELEAPLPLPEVEMDAGRIQHAVEAYVHHHLLHARPGERIRVSALPAGPRVRVAVRRDGASLPEQDAAAIFLREERAFRERKLEDPLRVHLARQEIEAHGGTVGVETDAHGSTLFFTLPVEAPLQPSPPATIQA
ncbi:HAMP domain-containing histidine kinase [Corallococcus sp. M34]|uniref:sensor histidine kinase n=1 Tax=Citreicoccus inhibens TaxID=2849499 RepID=UPI001C21F6BD|nr:HAMP domain-containing sensor histidine kinase [Citreicoccus inhibens]MBU8896872.1 HAMP domain-containing histidine kinase [Citreicoccus inhibens]